MSKNPCEIVDSVDQVLNICTPYTPCKLVLAICVDFGGNR